MYDFQMTKIIPKIRNKNPELVMDKELLDIYLVDIPDHQRKLRESYICRSNTLDFLAK